jgi:alkylated DNA nucleotide flippase Atl1
MGGLDEGRARRDAGTALVLNAPAQDQWRELAYRWLFELPTGQLVTSTDLIEAIGMPPSPNAVGAVMRAAGTQGALVPTDSYVSSTRPSCHAAVVRVWRAS